MKLEQTTGTKRDQTMWAKDVAAGAGLVLFMVWAFVLASGVQAALHHLPV